MSLLSKAFAIRFFASLALAAPIVVPALQPAIAQQRGLSTVRDAEIEALVTEYASPILQAAGLSRSGIEIVLVNDNSFNAFVAGRRIFINTGALMASETPNEIIGVLAHEAGHIAGGHQQRLREQLARAQTMAIIAAIAGVGATLGGALAGAEGLAQTGSGLMSGGIEAARRSLLSYQRNEEATADRSAITYLEKTGQSARGMLTTFERLAGSLSLSGRRIDPYEVSHPMPRERIANMETLARESRFFDRKDTPALQQRHDLMRAKIAAYTNGHAAATRLFRNNPRGLPALYADAIGTFLSGNSRSALAKIDALVKANPRNAYFQEMRGEVLMRANRPREAAEAYAAAMRLDPSRSGLIQIGRGQALMVSGGPENLKRAISELQGGLSRAKDYSVGYRYLAQAHAQLGNVAEAELATADGHFYSGNYQEARIFAARAQQKMRSGTPSWVRAQDIINYRQPGSR